MGWLFHTTDYGKKAFIEERTGNSTHGDNKWECLAHSLKGNHLWKVIRYTNLAKNEVRTFVALDLIAKERNGGWGYKDMDESAGPYYVDCPLKFLNMSDEPTAEYQYAVEWRKKVREHHANKNSTSKVTLEGGMKVKLNDGTSVQGRIIGHAILLRKYNRASWLAEVYDVDGKMMYHQIRIPSRHIKEVI